MRQFHKSINGFTMMPLILFMFVIVGLISAGYLMLGPKVQLGKTVKTKAGLEKAVDAIISWSVAKGRLPTTPPQTNEYATILGTTPIDSWGNPIYYIYDDTLANTAATDYGGLCGKAHTNLTVQTCPDTACTTPTNITPDVAFILLSGGSNYNNQTRATGPITAATTVNLYTAATNIDNYATDANRVEAYDDLFKIVTLEELKNRAGCYGSTGGRLKILNNELPKACSGQQYFSSSNPLNIYADGGVKTSYNWTPLPSFSGLTFTPASNILSIYGTSPSCPGGACPPSCIPKSDGYHCPITFNVTSDASISKTIDLIVISCTGGGKAINFTNDLPAFTTVAMRNGAASKDTTAKSVTLGGTAGRAGSSACLWYPYLYSLKNSTFRAYYEFKFANTDSSAQSNSYGDGFVITLMNGLFTDYASASCSTTTNGIGYQGLSAAGDRSSIATEYDTYPLINTTVNDSLTPGCFNHITLLNNTNVNHVRPTNVNYPLSTICNGSKAGCFRNPSPTAPANWLEDGALHKARLEVTGGCNSSCSNCSRSANSFKVWNNSGNSRYYRVNNGASLSACSATPVANGSSFPDDLQPGWSFNTYRNRSCTTSRIDINYADIVVSPSKDSNTDGCINLDLTDRSCNALAKTWLECDLAGCTDTSKALGDATRLIAQRCLPLPATMQESMFGITSGNGATTFQSILFSKFEANLYPAYRIWNNTAIPRWFTYTDGTSTTSCSSVAAGAEITAKLHPNGAINTYDNASCTDNANKLSVTYANIFGPPSKDTNGDGCVNLTQTDRSCTAPSSYRVWNNFGTDRWFRYTDGTTTSACSAFPVFAGQEFTTPTTMIASGWTLYTYTNSSCSNTGRTVTTFANINGPPLKDTNRDGCVQISATGAAGVTDRSCPTAPTPTCTLTAAPLIVAYNTASSFTWTITDGPANGTWLASPGGTCSNFVNSSGGSCTSAPLTLPGTNPYTLAVTNPGVGSNCAVTVNVGCQNYRVWNTTGVRYDFKRPDGTCVRINSGREITNASSRLAPGQSVTRYATNNRSCGGVATGAITYNQAMNVDITSNGGNGNCRINYGPGETAADR